MAEAKEKGEGKAMAAFADVTTPDDPRVLHRRPARPAPGAEGAGGPRRRHRVRCPSKRARRGTRRPWSPLTVARRRLGRVPADSAPRQAFCSCVCPGRPSPRPQRPGRRPVPGCLPHALDRRRSTCHPVGGTRRGLCGAQRLCQRTGSPQSRHQPSDASPAQGLRQPPLANTRGAWTPWTATCASTSSCPQPSSPSSCPTARAGHGSALSNRASPGVDHEHRSFARRSTRRMGRSPVLSRQPHRQGEYAPSSLGHESRHDDPPPHRSHRPQSAAGHGQGHRGRAGHEGDRRALPLHHQERQARDRGRPRRGRARQGGPARHRAAVAAGRRLHPRHRPAARGLQRHAVDAAGHRSRVGAASRPESSRRSSSPITAT